MACELDDDDDDDDDELELIYENDERLYNAPIRSDVDWSVHQRIDASGLFAIQYELDLEEEEE